MKDKINFRFGALSLMILVAALSRLLPHPPNFAPIGAMALFGAAYFSKRYLALLVPIVSMWISDLVINNIIYAQYFDGFVFAYPGFYWTYISFIIIGGFGFLFLKKLSLISLLFSSTMAAFIFYIVSNFGVWFSGTMYPKTTEGLSACYIAGIPFLKNTLAGNLFYTALMFGLFELVQYKFPLLKNSNIVYDKSVPKM